MIDLKWVDRVCETYIEIDREQTEEQKLRAQVLAERKRLRRALRRGFSLWRAAGLPQ